MKLSCFSYGKYHKIFIYLIFLDDFIICLEMKNREIIIDLCNFKNKKRRREKNLTPPFLYILSRYFRVISRTIFAD